MLAFENQNPTLVPPCYCTSVLVNPQSDLANTARPSNHSTTYNIELVL